MSTLTTLLQTSSIITSLLAAGGIATLTFFVVPILQSQPTSRSLPAMRWLFSRGSHVFPTAALISAAGFGALALQSLPLVSWRQLWREVATLGIRAMSARAPGYAAAALLCLSIGPYTGVVMLPNNFALIKLNADEGGSRSAHSAEVRSPSGAATGKEEKSALGSVEGEGEADEFKDLSGPQEKTRRDGGTGANDEKVRAMLGKFGRQNLVRAVLMGSGGMLGLLTALM
ncbi:hypothetical protein M406DRAFT_357240 [Cryphonectria parasitica EP155]|uniref:DUF1772-domain-containing protein n=1 Tax=Cryphonectria parasitica (strain ATCC 38755 / EP155) TaxID=660469 RepID=A0A9P5CNE3_CRYP1|nr:uncharacterized protein M406DRAFT_357240 [Cryphonectria parasitica EP155]KAF3763820.1 hypothetical protein M406DRAFT_357240 [Cryphonectria parasitica EP155]